MFQPDIVLSDLSMPGFSGDDALRIVRETSPEVPFIFVSGTMGEENAVAALQKGANDYIIKHQPARLPSAVARAIRDARSAVERARVETELMRAQRLESLSLLAAGLSHDLRNILQPLLIMPDLLKARTEDPQLHHLADVIAECGRRGHEMAESMLSFVRGSRKPSERIEIDGLFDAVALLLRSNVPDAVRLELQVLDEGLVVDANYTELQQVMLNLALNAIQAMPNGGRLSLTASHAGQRDGVDWMQICVSDEGIGMDADTLSHLFNPFFTTKADGTGLGLISCKRIVEGAGGASMSAANQGGAPASSCACRCTKPATAASRSSSWWPWAVASRSWWSTAKPRACRCSATRCPARGISCSWPPMARRRCAGCSRRRCRRW